MPRGGARKGAGRPKAAEHTLVAFRKARGKRRDDDEEEGIREVPYATTARELIRAIRKRVTSTGGGVATVKTPQIDQWTQGAVNYDLTHALYNEWPLVRTAVDWAVDTALENGYRTESDSEEAKKLCDKVGQVLGIDNRILPRWILALHRDGNIFEEIRWGKIDDEGFEQYTVPTQLFPIPASEMGYKWRNERGQEVEWAQSTGVGVWKPLKRDNLTAEAWRPDGYDPFGTPIVSSVIGDVEELLKFETDFREIIRWYIKPLWHILVGTPDKPASATLLQDVKDSWEDREPNTDLITAGNIKIESHGVELPDVEQYVTYHDNKLVDGLQSPFSHVLRSANQASASEIRANSFSRVVFIQRWLKRQLEQFFRTVLAVNNIKAEVKVVFKPLRSIPLFDKIKLFVQLLDPQGVQLSDETRLEIENQLRMELLDVPRDDTLKQTTQPMPGQQGLFSRFRRRILRTQTPEQEEEKTESEGG